jgi:hypothetical protein
MAVMYFCKVLTGYVANILLTITIAKCLDPLRHYYCCRPANGLQSFDITATSGVLWTVVEHDSLLTNHIICAIITHYISFSTQSYHVVKP